MHNPASAENGKKGGRPIISPENRLQIPEITFVILTKSQYDNLISKYGFSLIQKALKILDNWLGKSPEGNKYCGKNNYAHFRSDGWVINTAKRE